MGENSHPYWRKSAIERARVMRWFGSNDLGLVFFSRQAGGRLISQREYDEWRIQLQTWVADAFDSTSESGVSVAVPTCVGLLILIVSFNDGESVHSIITALLSIIILIVMLYVIAQPSIKYYRELNAHRVNLENRVQFRPIVVLPHSKERRRNGIRRLGIVLPLVITALTMLSIPFPAAEAFVARAGLWIFLGGAFLTPFLVWAANKIDRVHLGALREWWRFD